MALTYCIRNLISLLAVPENKITEKRSDAFKIIQITNNYICSPTFILFGGNWLKKKVSNKFSLNDKINKKNMCMALPTALFSDEIIMIVALIISLILMNNIWLVKWQSESYTAAYNKIYTSEALTLACVHPSHQECFPCDQFITLDINDNINKIQPISSNRCNNKIKPVNCPLIEKNGLKAIMVASETHQYDYADPNSFINDSYLVYTKPGRGWHSWFVTICNKTNQAEYAKHDVIPKWKLYSGLIIIGCIFFYVIVNIILHCSYKSMIDSSSFDIENELINPSENQSKPSNPYDSYIMTKPNVPNVLSESYGSYNPYVFYQPIEKPPSYEVSVQGSILYENTEYDVGYY
jgi:hypothetical protein